MSVKQRNIFSVSRLNQEVKQTLLNSFEPLWIEGEISNLATPTSGHMYFSLKDKYAQVRCALFRSHNRALNFKIQDGMLVLAYGRIDLYAARGEFQIIVDLLEPIGAGDLKKQFEALKNALAKEGLFDAERKRAIPAFPQGVGIITSAKSAALADILKIYQQRLSPSETIIYPVQVQGHTAPTTICHALSIANRRKETEVLIIARGGGSFEDLQAFNDERVVRAVADSKIPIVSGVGHDIDFTLTDFAADLRTPTPTAAAISTYPDGTALTHQLTMMQQHLTRNVSHQISLQKNQMKIFKAQLTQFHPQVRIKNLMQRLDEISAKLITKMHDNCNIQKINLLKLLRKYERSIPLGAIKNFQTRVERSSDRLHAAMSYQLTQHTHALERNKVQLHTISPYATLKRGYSITTDISGRLIRTPRQVRRGDIIHIQVEKGAIGAAVNKTRLNHKKNT